MTRDRIENYATDSTRGRSLMRPETFKNDVTVQVWLESRYLATLSEWLDSSGERPRFLSEVVRAGVEGLVSGLVSNGQVDMIEDTQIAREMLERKFKVNLNVRNRGKKNAFHNLLLTEERREVINEGSYGRNIDRIKGRVKPTEKELEEIREMITKANVVKEKRENEKRLKDIEEHQRKIGIDTIESKEFSEEVNQEHLNAIKAKDDAIRDM